MRTVFVAGGTLVLAALVYGSRVGSQAAPPKPAPRPRIALLNLTYVVKNYKKFETFQHEIKKAIEPYQQRDANLKAKVEAVAKQAQDEDLAEKKKEALSERLKLLQRQVEDNNTAAKKFLSEKGDKTMKVLYEDIQQEATRFAKANDIDLLLHYGDATTKEDLESPENIQRKLQAGALLPLFAAEGLDVSKPIVEALNEKYKAAP
jgi:Skp family chaperone for outer membrane proteins